MTCQDPEGCKINPDRCVCDESTGIREFDSAAKVVKFLMKLSPKYDLLPEEVKQKLNSDMPDDEFLAYSKQHFEAVYKE